MAFLNETWNEKPISTPIRSFRPTYTLYAGDVAVECQDGGLTPTPRATCLNFTNGPNRRERRRLAKIQRQARKKGR